ncbi:uncharacterized protein LOC125954262 isoform X2 [Anopheles darlingi]|nr:uncharacterized protein LOC125954262 isoform X2 [Anopheles darlingi]
MDHPKCNMSNKEIRFEWDILAKKRLQNWDKNDLQLAAELGKTLLERNKELEATVKYHQHVIEDKMQEIEYLTKQNGALREVNDSRMKIYEQLEVSIQDLERDKYKLALDYKAEKKITKQLHSTIESLETKVEELTRTLVDERRQADIERRYIAKQQAAAPASNDIVELTSLPSPTSATSEQERPSGTVQDVQELHHNDDTDEELIRVILLLERTQKSFAQERDKVSELEEQLMVITQENQALQKKLSQKTNNDEVKPVHQELSLLDELKQGQMCTNCLRDLADRRDENSIISANDEDDRSLYNLIEASEAPKNYCSTVYIKLSTPESNGGKIQTDGGCVANNPYRELIEKYEALLEVHRKPIQSLDSKTASGSGNNTPVESCQPQELSKRSGFGNDSHYLIGFNPPVTSERTNDNQLHGTASATATGPTRSMVIVSSDNHYRPETASSGYLDDVCNKATQTDESSRNFLCTIADGMDRFSIYEDQSAIDSRFRFSPAHRELFREIFSVLKKAAENREGGEQLPLLDDTKSDAIGMGSVVEPVTPINEMPPTDFGEDDTASFVTTSSAISEQSFAISECITRSERQKRVRKQASAIAAARQGSAVLQKESDISSKPVTNAGNGGVSYATPPSVDRTGTLQQSYEPLEYLSGRKRKSHRRSSNRTHATPGNKVSETGEQQHRPSTPQTPRGKGSRRNRYRPWNPDIHGSFGSNRVPLPRVNDDIRPVNLRWDGSSLPVPNRSPTVSSMSPSVEGANSTNTMKSKSGVSTINRYAELADDASDIVELVPSTASQRLHMLHELDLSYAEVLRRANTRQPYNVRRPKQN